MIGYSDIPKKIKTFKHLFIRVVTNYEWEIHISDNCYTKELMKLISKYDIPTSSSASYKVDEDDKTIVKVIQYYGDLDYKRDSYKHGTPYFRNRKHAMDPIIVEYLETVENNGVVEESNINFERCAVISKKNRSPRKVSGDVITRHYNIMKLGDL